MPLWPGGRLGGPSAPATWTAAAYAKVDRMAEETSSVTETKPKAKKAKSKPVRYRAVNGINLPPDDTRYEAGEELPSSPGPVTRAAIRALVQSGDIEETR